MGKTVFDLYKVKINIFLNFSSFLALKKIKKNTFPLSQACKTKERGNIET